MSNTLDSTAPLVGVAGADNTFLVPDVIHRTVVSDEKLNNNHKSPDELFDRDVLLQQGTILSTDVSNTNILGNFDPFGLYLSNAIVTNALKPYDFVNFGLIITVRMITPGSCYGLYNVQALCEGGENYAVSPPKMDGPAMDAYPNSTQDIHGFLNLELRNNVVLELPWEHPLNGVQLPFTGTLNCWRLLLWPLAPIRSTLATTVGGTYQIFGRMARNRNFVNLRLQGKKSHPVAGALGTASSMTGVLTSMMPSIAPYTMPVAAGLAAMSSIADALGFTRESAPQTATPTVQRLTTSLAPTDNQDLSEVVALSVSNTLSIDPAPGGGESIDPMSYASLFEKWTVIDLFEISDESSGIVREIAVSPYTSNTLPGFYPGNPNQFYPSVGGWVGLPFSSWRGGMEYMIYIPSSSNLQGSLQILWEPTFPSTTVFTTDPTNSLSNVVIDLKGTSKTVLNVGYSNIKPVMKSVFIPSGSSSPYANGHLIFRIMSPLVSPLNIAVSINVIVMARPMKDMEFGFPRNRYSVHQNAEPTTPFGYPLEDFRYQAENEDDEVENIIELVPSFSYPTVALHYGEHLGSVRALIQHFNTVTAFGSSNSTIYFQHFFPVSCSQRAAIGYPYYSTPSTVPEYLQPPFTYYAYYLSAFVGVRGSTRYKVHVTSGTGTAIGTAAGLDDDADYPYILDYYGSARGPDSNILDVQGVSASNGAEFAIPSRLYNKFYNIRTMWSVLTFNHDYRQDAISIKGDVAGFVSLAAGPDTTVTRFRRIPAMLLQADTP